MTECRMDRLEVRGVGLATRLNGCPLSHNRAPLSVLSYPDPRVAHTLVWSFAPDNNGRAVRNPNRVQSDAEPGGRPCFHECQPLGLAHDIAVGGDELEVFCCELVVEGGITGGDGSGHRCFRVANLLLFTSESS